MYTFKTELIEYYRELVTRKNVTLATIAEKSGIPRDSVLKILYGSKAVCEDEVAENLLNAICELTDSAVRYKIPPRPVACPGRKKKIKAGGAKRVALQNKPNREI